MNIETFFEKFEMFAEAPGAVARMRELVLELAVQGKLVVQNPDDGDANQLLADIRRERNGKAAKLPPSEETAPDCDKRPFQIPSRWAWTQLTNIALRIQYGYTASADPSAMEIRMLRITDIQNNRVNWPSVPGCQIEQEEAEKYLLSANDILIARTGGTIGKSFLVPDAPVKAVFASYLIRVSPPRSMSARYLKMFLESPFYWSQLRQMSAGTGQPNVNGQALGRLEIPLPPLAEQKRIVAKVDELMALCDRLEARQQERETRHAALARASLARFADAPTPANLQFLFHPSYAVSPADLRKSILTLAVQGKLVSQDPNDEPGKKLLDTPKKAEGKKPKWAGPIEEKEKPFQLPASWTWFRLGDISSLKHGYAFSSKFFTDEPAPFVLTTPGNFYEKGGFRDRESKRKYYSGPVDPEFIFKPGDLIIPMTEQAAGLLGSPAFIPDHGRVYIHNQRLGKLSFSEAVAPEFAFWFFNCEFFRGELARTCTGMKVRHTSPDRILRVPFPVCPLAEQRRIVTKVDQLMALVDELEVQIAASRTTAANLLEALVAELTAAGEKTTSDPKIILLHSTPEFIRAQLAAEIVHRMCGDEFFGQTKLQKELYLAEYLFELREIDSRPQRFARGPHDPELIAGVEHKMNECEWFETVRRDGKEGWKYRALAKAGEHRPFFERQWPDKADGIRRLIGMMKTWSTERCERFATVYAAWNDLIHWKKPVTDAAILRQVLEHWHPDKVQIPKAKWVETLEWMRREGHVPVGFGRATQSEPQDELLPGVIV